MGMPPDMILRWHLRYVLQRKHTVLHPQNLQSSMQELVLVSLNRVLLIQSMNLPHAESLQAQRVRVLDSQFLNFIPQFSNALNRAQNLSDVECLYLVMQDIYAFSISYTLGQSLFTIR